MLETVQNERSLERKANADRSSRRENLFKRSHSITTPRPKLAVLPFEFPTPTSTQPDTRPINFSTSQQSTFRNFLFLLHGSLHSFVPIRRGFVHLGCPGAPLSRPPSLQKWIKSRLSLIAGHNRSVTEYFYP